MFDKDAHLEGCASELVSDDSQENSATDENGCFIATISIIIIINYAVWWRDWTCTL